MPLLINVLRFFAFNAVGWLLAGAGIGFATYQGFQFVNDRLIEMMQQNFSSLDPQILNLFFMFGIPQGLSLWISGAVLGMAVMSARLAIVKLG